MLARKVDHRAVLGQPVAWPGESAAVFLELFAAGADIKVALRIVADSGHAGTLPSAVN